MGLKSSSLTEGSIMKRIKQITIACSFLLLMACSQQPAEIHYGSDECAHCKMMITDDRFASQLVLETGKAIKFDSIECMAAYAGDHKPALESAKLWVSDFSNPGDWLEVQSAHLIKSEIINSPMGASLLAIGSSEAVKKHLKEYPGEPIEWKRIVK